MSFTIQSGKTLDEAIDQALYKLGASRDQVEVEVLEEGSKGLFGFLGSKEAVVKVSLIQDTKDLLDDILEAGGKEDSPPSPQPGPVQEDRPQAGEEESSAEDPFESEKEDRPVEEGLDPQESGGEPEEIIRGLVAEIMSALDLEYDLEISKGYQGDVEAYFASIEGNKSDMGLVIGKKGVTLDAIQYILTLLVNKDSSDYIRIVLDCSDYRKKRRDQVISLAERKAKQAIKTRSKVRLAPMNPAERRIVHTALQDFDGVMTHSEGKEPNRRVVIQPETQY